MVEILEEIGLPFAYDHFAEGENPEPPFICYRTPGSSNFSADGCVYLKTDNIYLELYTDRKDVDTEERIEAVLDRHGCFYDKTETYIESERLYEVMYYLGGINTWEIK